MPRTRLDDYAAAPARWILMSAPKLRTARRPMIWITAAGLFAITAYVIVRSVQCGADPHCYDGYRYRSSEPVDWAYPTASIVRWSIAIAIQWLIATAIVIRPRASGGDAIVMGVLAGGLFVGAAPIGMHAGGSLAANFGWLFLVAIWLVLSGVVHLGVARLQSAPNGRYAAQ